MDTAPMFEQFVTRLKCLQLHRRAPMRKLRERYLRHLSEEGRAAATFVHAAGYILHAAILLDLRRGQTVNEEDLRVLGRKWRDGNFRGGVGRRKPSADTVQTFLGRVRHWLRFCGRMEKPKFVRPFDRLLRRFLGFKRVEHGWSASTIDIYRRDVGLFLSWADGLVGNDLSKLDARTLTTYLQEPQFARWSRCSIASHVCHVRVFLRWLGARRGCDPRLWDCIRAPRIYRHERYPQGPTWAQVRELLDSTDTCHPTDVRDRAMILLTATYGFRSGEVRNLRLEDIDWDNGIIRPSRPKTHRVGTYPLTPVVGNAVIAYLKIRPACRIREVFVSVDQPYRPLSRGGLGGAIRRRQKSLGQKLKRYGPHGLRHACASRLLAEGFTLKQIGDHLGHSVVEATEIYAKVDVASATRRYLDGDGPRTNNWLAKYYILGGFYRFAISRKYAAVSPLPPDKPRRQWSFVPYIYSVDDMKSLLEAADRRFRNCWLVSPATMRTLLLLLYGSGLRISEALALNLGDVDLDARVLTIGQTKFYKRRLVPIGNDLRGVLLNHRHTHRLGTAADGDPFLTDRKGQRIAKQTAQLSYKRIREYAGLRRPPGCRLQPRLHDLRHTFAVNRLISWYRAGKNVQQLLPHLATYLGHCSIRETQVYLQLTSDLAQEASALFLQYAQPAAG